MALTSEMIKANDVLANLSDEQVTAIATLSANDEDAVIGKRFGEVYRELDSTIEKNTGIKREGAEKTYVYLERATKAFADKYADYDTVKGQVASLTAENAKLEERIAKGGDAALKEQNEALQKELVSTKKQFTDLQAKHENAESEYRKSMNDYKINAEIAKARGELKLKSGMNDAVMSTLVGKAIENVKAKNPSFEERNGVEVLVFHAEDGSPLNNEKNRLNPYTAKELLESEFASMDLLEKKASGGAGGKQTNPTGGRSIAAQTRREADDEINKLLTADGYVRGTSEYQEKYSQMWDENKVDELPR